LRCIAHRARCRTWPRRPAARAEEPVHPRSRRARRRGAEAFARRSVVAEQSLTETVAEIVEAHRAGRVRPAETVARSFTRIKANGDPPVFISLRDEAEAIADADAAAAAGPDGPPPRGVAAPIQD